jgi:hypothetical protein
VSTLAEHAGVEGGQLRAAAGHQLAGVLVHPAEPQLSIEDFAFLAQHRGGEQPVPVEQLAVAEQVPAVPEVLEERVHRRVDRGGGVDPRAGLHVHRGADEVQCGPPGDDRGERPPAGPDVPRVTDQCGQIAELGDVRADLGEHVDRAADRAGVQVHEPVRRAGRRLGERGQHPVGQLAVQLHQVQRVQRLHDRQPDRDAVGEEVAADTGQRQQLVPAPGQLLRRQRAEQHPV